MTDQSNIQEQFTEKREHATTREEGTTEAIDLTQLIQVLTGQEVRGVEITYPTKEVEPVPGTELAKHRVRVSFDFDVACNTEPIINASDDTVAIGHDIALLKSFLTADKTKLLDMMVDCIGQKLGMHSTETFMREFLSQVKTNSHDLFGPAIDALRGESGEYWREAREDDDLPWGDVLSLSTELQFKCFSAQFVSSSYEVVEEQNVTRHKKDVPTLILGYPTDEEWNAILDALDTEALAVLKDTTAEPRPQHTMTIRWSHEDECYLVSLPVLQGQLLNWDAAAHGDTYEEAARNGSEVLKMIFASQKGQETND